MTSEPIPKFRYVRCPKCRNLLKEVADVPIYRCGGCGTFLKAKSRQNSTSTSSGLREANAPLNNGPDNVSEDIEPELSKWSALDESKVVNLTVKDKVNDENYQNKHEFEGKQRRSVTSEDEEEKNSGSLQSQPQEVKCERSETNLPSEDGEGVCNQAEYEGCSTEHQGYIHNEHPRVANSSFDQEENGGDEDKSNAPLNNGPDNVSEDIEPELSKWSALDESKVVNLTVKDKVNDENYQNKHEFEGKQRRSVTSEDEEEKNSGSLQSQPQEVKCERSETNLPSEDGEGVCNQAEYGGCSTEHQGYIHNEHPRVANSSFDQEENGGDGDKSNAPLNNGPDNVSEDIEPELSKWSALDESKVVNLTVKDKVNDENYQNKHEFEGKQRRSVTSEDEEEKNSGSLQSQPQEVKCERSETNLPSEDGEGVCNQAEYGGCSTEHQGYIHNEHPRVANSSFDQEENGGDEDKSRKCKNGGSYQNNQGKFEGEQHGSVASEDEGEQNYRSDKRQPHRDKYERSERTFLSENIKTASDQYEYGKCSIDSEGYIHDDNVRVANPSSDGKENEIDEHELRDYIRGLLREVDDEQSGVEDKHNVVNQNDSGNYEVEQLGSVNVLTSRSESVDCDNEEKSSARGGVSEEDTNGDTSLLAGAISEAKAKNKSISHSRTSSAGSLEVRMEVASPVANSTGTSSTNTLVSSPKEELGQSQRRVHSRIRSVETVASAEYGDHSSEFSNDLEDPAKSLNTVGSHVYDGSVSSYDGSEYDLPDRHSLHLHNTNVEIPIGTKLRSDKQFLNTRMNKSLEMERLARNSMSTSFEKKPFSMRTRLTHDKYADPARHHHPVGHLITPDRDNYPYMSPVYQQGVLSGYESGGPSESQSNTSHYSPGNPDSSGQERLKLLQMLYELLDQLKKTGDIKGISGGGISREDASRGTNFPMYSRQGDPEGLNIQDFRDRYTGRHRGGSNLMNEHRVSRIPYSGQVTYDRNYTNDPFPADWRYSAPLPPSIPNQNDGLRGIRPGSYSPYSSHVSSSSQFMDYKLSLRSGEIQSDEEIPDNRIAKKHSKEKHLSDKRHFLPTAGGAPFVTCHRCSNLLQLPGDFLLNKGRLHRLKCGSCSELLKFSLQNKRQLVQCTEYMDSPTNGFDELINETNGDNVASTCHGKDIPQVHPLADAGDNGNSFQKSCSAEGDFPAVSQFLQGKTIGRTFSNKSPEEPQRDHENLVRKEFENKHTNAGKTGGVNHTLSPQSEKITASSSPLHRLMGYSTPRHVIHGSGVSGARETSPDE